MVQKQEQEASGKAKVCESIAADAQRDLDEALPALVYQTRFSLNIIFPSNFGLHA